MQKLTQHPSQAHANSPEDGDKANWPTFPKLVRHRPRPLALEQRFMFDGAAAVDAVHLMARADDGGQATGLATPADVSPDPAPAPALLQITPPTGGELNTVLSASRSDAQRLVQAYLSGEDASAKLFASLNGSLESPSQAWTQAAGDLLAHLRSGVLSIDVQLRSDSEMRGAMGAFAQTGTEGKPTIYLNADWISQNASAAELTSVLVEELGHAFDAMLNPGADTAGDEGQRFAAAVLGRDLTAPGFASDNDHARLDLDGTTVEVELASYTFVNAYQVNTTSTPAGKESNTHDFIYSATITPVAIDDGNISSNAFSGNDVSATALQIGGVDYFGWISRPIKVGGQVKGFYFWTDADFTTLPAAQADGNADGDGNVADNSAFVLVVDQSYFTGLAFNAGSTTLKNVGSSSDRVDSALNSLVTANVAPVATDDQSNGTPGASGGAALERGFNSNTSMELVATINATGNILTNDSDPGDTLTVTQVKSNASNATVSVGGTPGVLLGRYGTLTLNANGTYSYAIDNANPTIDALLTGGTLSEAFTYTVSDGKGGTASATLTVQINGSNDAPVAQNDYNTAKEITTTANTGYTATGNVLPNDSDVDFGDGKSLFGFTVNGAISGTTVAVTSGTYSLTLSGSPAITNGDWAFVNAGGGFGGLYYFDSADSAHHYKIVTFTKTGSGGSAVYGFSRLPTYYYNVATSTYTQIVDYVNFFGTNPNLANSPPGTDANDTGETTTLGGSVKAVTVASATISSPGFTTISGLSNETGTIAVGMSVSGTDVLSGTQVSAITYNPDGTIATIRLDKEFLSSAAGNFTFTKTVALGSDISVAGAHGTLIINYQGVQGAYLYTPTTNDPSLSSGQSAIEVFDYTMRDTAGATSAAKLYITVYGSGSNDPVVVADTATAYEAGVGRDPTSPYALTGDNTIFGGADAAAGTTLAGVLGNDTPGTGGVVVAYTKADGTGSVAAGNNLVGAYGTLNIGANGTYTYVVDDGNVTVDALLPGASLTETFRYRVTNTALGINWSTLTVTIQGTNDAPAAVVDTGALTEDAVLTASGNVLSNDTDADSGDTRVVSKAGTSSANSAVTASTTSANGLSVGGTYGTLTIGADGTYQYVLATSSDATRYAALQALTNGATAPEVFSYEVKDTSSATSVTTLTFTITGANEPPVNAFPAAIATGVNTPVSFTGGNLVSVSDADGNLSKVTLNVDQGTLAVTLSGAATVSAGGTGTSTLTLSGSAADINATLASLIYTPGSGFAGTDSLTIFSQDSLFAFDSDAIAITVSNSSAPAVISGDATGGVTEDAATPTLSDTGTLSITDPDTGEAAFQTTGITASTGALGSLAISSAGAWTYTVPNAAVQYLAAGQTKVETFTVTSTDGTTREVVITIQGLDEPVPSVNSIVVNEASLFAVFEVTGPAGQAITLDLQESTAEGDGTDYGAAGPVNLAVSTDGGATWGHYTGTATIPADGKLLVRTPLTNDDQADNNEVFTLTARNAQGLSSAGTATIRDDGTGSIFRDDGSNDPGAVRDDDRAVTVSSPVVNEASPHAYFSVAGAPNQWVTLALTSGTAGGGGADFGAGDGNNITISTDGGLTWSPYPGGPIALPGSGQLLVRTPLVDDALPDNNEQFTLTATNTGGSQGVGVATIKDDGTGTVFLPDGTADPAGVPTDDRPRPAVPAAPPPPPAVPQQEPMLPADPTPVPSAPLVFSTIQVPERLVITEIYTSSTGFRTSVVEGAVAALFLSNGITDQAVENRGTLVSFVLPADAFAHTRSEAVITLTAKLSDGSPLPLWIAFDGQSGTFRITAPPGLSEELEVMVIARDNEGREVTAKFRLFVKAQPDQQSREGLTTQIRLAARHASPLAELSRSASGPDDRPTSRLASRSRT